jgi:hypothetical protein
MTIDRDDSVCDWRKFPVIRLSFSGFADKPDQFEADIISKLNSAA